MAAAGEPFKEASVTVWVRLGHEPGHGLPCQPLMDCHGLTSTSFLFVFAAYKANGHHTLNTSKHTDT